MYVNNIRSPNNIFVACWLLVLGIVFFTPRSVCAFTSNSVIPGDSDWKVPNYNVQLNKEAYEYYPYSIHPEFSEKDEWWYSDYNKVPSVTHYEGVQFSVSDEYLDSLPSELKLSDGRYCVPIVLSGRLGAQVYPNAVVKNVFINKGDKISLAVMGTYPGKYFEVCQLVNGQYVNNDNTYYYSVDGIYLPKSANVEGFEPQYDVNDLKSYPVNSINIISPSKGSNIKTNNGYFDVVIKGKIGIDFSKSLLGNTLFPMTPELIGNYIRRDFRYSVDGDVEDENNLSYLGVGNKNFSNYIIEYLNQFYQDINPFVDKDKIGDINTIWTIGVTGNMNDWSKKHYYNFIINTRLWCGYLNNDLNYKFSFIVPVAFSGNLTDVNPSEYKTIFIDNYSLKRGFYSDDDFDGIDDESNEIIPPDEIEIIHPSTSTPSLPSDDGLDDGLQVVNILKDIYKDFCHGVNGSVNILKSFFSVVNSTVKSVCDYSQQMVISFSNIFGFMPSPIPQLITMSLAIMIFVSVLGFIKK